jgi:hypothetical protein
VNVNEDMTFWYQTLIGCTGRKALSIPRPLQRHDREGRQ